MKSLASDETIIVFKVVPRSQFGRIWSCNRLCDLGRATHESLQLETYIRSHLSSYFYWQY